MCKELNLLSQRPVLLPCWSVLPWPLVRMTWGPWGWRGSHGQGSDSEERMSIEKCGSVQVYWPVGLPEINDLRVTHYFILSIALFSEFYFLTLWKHSTYTSQWCFHQLLLWGRNFPLRWGFNEFGLGVVCFLLQGWRVTLLISLTFINITHVW